MNTTPGVHHVTLLAADAERSAVFYGEVLGMRPLRRESHPGRPEVARLWFSAGEEGGPGSLVSVLAGIGAPPGRPGIGGVHHTAFGVDTDEALLKWKRRLTDLGWAASGPYDRGYFTSLYFRDPDGQILEIATAGPGYAVDEAADALGGELVLPPQRIVRGHRDEVAIAALTHPEAVPEITADMALRGIHHVSGITDDLQRADAFLKAALGLRLVKRTTNRDDPKQLHYFWARYEGGEVAPHSAYTLFGWPGGWNRAREGVGQTQSVAFRAADEAELAEGAERLRSLGVEVAEPAERGGYRSIRFRAPDGQGMEIATDGPAA